MCLQYSFHTGGENGLSLRLSGLHTTISCQCAILIPMHTLVSFPYTHGIHMQYILTTFPTQHMVLGFKVGAAPPLRPTATSTAPATYTREVTLKGGWWVHVDITCKYQTSGPTWHARLPHDCKRRRPAIKCYSTTNAEMLIKRKGVQMW